MQWSRSPQSGTPKVALLAVLSYASPSHITSPTPRQAIEVAGSKHPEARVLTVCQEETLVKRNAASTLVPASPSIELAEYASWFNENRGGHEIEPAVSVPLWRSKTAIAPFSLASLKRLDPVAATDFSFAYDCVSVTPSFPLMRL